MDIKVTHEFQDEFEYKDYVMRLDSWETANSILQTVKADFSECAIGNTNNLLATELDADSDALSAIGCRLLSYLMKTIEACKD